MGETGLWWAEDIKACTDAQLIGIWENGVAMTHDEYMIWLEEVKARGLQKQVFGGK